jgi:hypothetical protein
MSKILIFQDLQSALQLQKKGKRNTEFWESNNTQKEKFEIKQDNDH